MPDRLHPLARLLVGLLGLLSALTAIYQALLLASLGFHPVLLLGTAGALGATVILLRSHRGRAPPSKTAVVLLVLGLAAGAGGVGFSARAYLRTYERVYITGMMGDLRSLVRAQESYFGAHRLYARTLAHLSREFKPSAGVTISFTVSGQDLQATATHSDLPGVSCAIYIGDTPIAPAFEEREPACNR